MDPHVCRPCRLITIWFISQLKYIRKNKACQLDKSQNVFFYIYVPLTSEMMAMPCYEVCSTDNSATVIFCLNGSKSY